MGTKNLDKSGRVATSIKIKPDVWKEAKKSAIDNEIDVSQLVEKAIEKWIEIEHEDDD